MRCNQCEGDTKRCTSSNQFQETRRTNVSEKLIWQHGLREPRTINTGSAHASHSRWCCQLKHCTQKTLILNPNVPRRQQSQTDGAAIPCQSVGRKPTAQLCDT